MGVPNVGPFEVLLATRVEITGACWLWSAATDKHGYGWISLANRKVKAHRWVYENLVGPIPEGLVIDHLCRIHNCVNPDHLEPVTQRVNSQRGYWGIKRFCPGGHDQTDPQHVYLRPGNGKRMCKTCPREAARRRRSAA